METVYPVATFTLLPCSMLPSSKSKASTFPFLHSQSRNKRLEYENRGFSSQFISKCIASSKFLISQSGNEGLNYAEQLFDNLPNRDVVSRSALIVAYSRRGNFTQAYELLQKMVGEGLQPDGFALASLLKVSSSAGEVGLSRQIHGWSIRTGFLLDSEIMTALITMYSHCGMLNDARRVFDQNSVLALDIFLWNSILAAYIFHGCWVEVISLFGKMMSLGLVAPTELTYAGVVNACGSLGEERHGATIHGKIIKDGLPDATHLWNSLVTFYGKCGNIEYASQLFERIPRKDVVSWNAMIAANEKEGRGDNAVDLFRRMLKVQPLVQPNRVTFLSLLSAVSGLSALKCGREIHAHIIRLGFEVDTCIANSLITLYSKCGEVGKARVIFESLLLRDIISWNAMLAGYEQNDQQGRCFDIFKRMTLSGIEPDSHSLTVILSAASHDSSGLTYLRRGKEIHGYILRRSSLGGVSLSVSNAMLKMYAKFNHIADVEEIFKGMKDRDSYSWNAMMDGYLRNAKFEDALIISLDILEQGFPLDHLSLSILLTSCGRLASLQLGKQFHSVIVKRFYGQDCHHDSLLSINNALISMYSKCGSIEDAAQVFVKMERKDVFSWTAMITGCAHHGMAFKSLQLFERMKKDGVKPNQVTFLALLMACAHGGLVKEGNYYFDSMINDYGLNPSVEHYACMIDLFARSGRFDRAKNLVESGITLFKPCHDDFLNLWKVLLGACHASKRLNLGVEAATKILELEPEDEATYILLANLYASSGLWEDAVKVRKAMKDRGLKKEAGCSWIDTGNRRHIFVAGDVFHPRREEIYEKLAQLNFSCRRMGYVPMTELVLHDVDERQKEAILGCHSEKLAVSFGLLNCGVGNGAIRVMKNLRVCEDCHSWMKFASLLERREIILRDSRRFHLFRGGSCSCGDFW